MNCYLHIGTGKTGTTTLQYFLRDNRKKLKKNYRILYSKYAGNGRHTKLSWYTANNNTINNKPTWKRSGNTDLDGFRDVFYRGFAKEVSKCDVRSVILSDEALWSLSAKGIERLKALLSGLFEQIFIIVYFRRQDKHLISRYQQTIKVGKTHTIEEFIEKCSNMRTYRYFQTLEVWSRYFGKQNVRARLFDLSAFVDKSLIIDFLSQVDIESTSGLDYFNMPRKNRRLDAYRTEFLRRLNAHFPLFKDGKENPLRGDIVRLLQKHSEKGTRFVDSGRLSDFLDGYAEENRHLVHEYIGKEDGRLMDSVSEYDKNGLRDTLDLEKCLEITAELWESKQKQLLRI